MNTSPEVAISSPVRILKVVVFPAPFNPSNPKHSSFWMVREIFLTARVGGILKYILKTMKTQNTWKMYWSNTKFQTFTDSNASDRFTRTLPPVLGDLLAISPQVHHELPVLILGNEVICWTLKGVYLYEFFNEHSRIQRVPRMLQDSLFFILYIFVFWVSG